MKRRTFKHYKTKKRGGQHYWVKRYTKRNYAGGPLFGRHLKEKGVKLEGTPKERRVIRRLFERNPELIEGGTTVTSADLPKIGRVPLGVYYHEPKIIKIDKEFLLTGKRSIPTKNDKVIIFGYPENTPEKTFKHEIAHSRQSRAPDIFYDRMIIKTPLKDILLKEEEEARIADQILPQRKRKVSQEQMAKSFRDIIK